MPVHNFGTRCGTDRTIGLHKSIRPHRVPLKRANRDGTSMRKFEHEAALVLNMYMRLRARSFLACCPNYAAALNLSYSAHSTLDLIFAFVLCCLLDGPTKFV